MRNMIKPQRVLGILEGKASFKTAADFKMNDDEMLASNSRKALAKMMIKLLDHWGLDDADRLELLGLDADCQSVLDQFRSGEAALPETGDTMERAGGLLAIHRELRTIFPRNRDLVYQWVTAKNQRFDGNTPLEVMKWDGLAGIKKIAVYLESI